MKTKLLLFFLFAFVLKAQAQNGIASFTAPVEALRNSNASVTINYTANVAGQYQFQVFPKNADNSINFGAGGTSIFAGGVLPAAPTGGTFTSSPTDLYVDPAFALGDYIWFIKITVGGTDYFTATNQLISIVTTLNTNSFSIDVSELFVNSKLKTLEVNRTNLKSESAKIYDITGKLVVNISKLQNTSTLSLSNLNKGVYVLVTNDNRKLKFLL